MDVTAQNISVDKAAVAEAPDNQTKLDSLAQDLPDLSEWSEDKIGELFETDEVERPETPEGQPEGTEAQGQASEQPKQEEQPQPDGQAVQPGQPLDKATFTLFGKPVEITPPQLERMLTRAGELEQMATSPEGRMLIDNAEPLLEIYNALQTDPALVEYIRQYPGSQAGQSGRQPGANLRQSLAQEAAQIISPQLQAQQDAMRQAMYQQTNAMLQADPDYSEVMQLAFASLGQDAAQGKIDYAQAARIQQEVAANPTVLSQVYRHFRQELGKQRQTAAQSQAEGGQVRQAMEQTATRRVSKAPLLEAGRGGADLESQAAKQRQIVERAMQGDEYYIGLLYDE